MSESTEDRVLILIDITDREVAAADELQPRTVRDPEDNHFVLLPVARYLALLQGRRRREP